MRNYQWPQVLRDSTSLLVSVVTAAVTPCSGISWASSSPLLQASQAWEDVQKLQVPHRWQEFCKPPQDCPPNDLCWTPHSWLCWEGSPGPPETHNTDILSSWTSKLLKVLPAPLHPGPWTGREDRKQAFLGNTWGSSCFIIFPFPPPYLSWGSECLLGWLKWEKTTWWASRRNYQGKTEINVTVSLWNLLSINIKK